MRPVGAGLLLAGALGAGCIQAPAGGAPEGFKPAEQALGERFFRDPRFSQWFATHLSSVNAAPSAGDPTVETSVDALGPPLPGSLAGAAMACSLCHLVEQNARDDGTRMRAYSDFARRSPIPDRGDGRHETPRNSPPMVDALVERPGPVFLHLDGEFATPESLIEATFLGRNLGWLPTERGTALAHLARIVREDEGKMYQGPDPSGMSYAIAFLAEDTRIKARLRLPAAYRLDVHQASDEEVLGAVAKVVAAYMRGLTYHRDPSGTYDASPYDAFLALNDLPRTPDEGESPLAYARRLRTALAGLGSPRWVTPSAGSFIHHDRPFAFGSEELAGLRIFLAEPSAPSGPSGGGTGACLGCHPPPDFTDHLFHNAGVSQEEYDGVHGPGAFRGLAVPDLAARNADPEAFLPPSAAHPTARGGFRSAPRAEDPGLADLGLWNVFGNPDMPGVQAALDSVLCATGTACSPAAVLGGTLGQFKTPGLRDLDDSAPYLHNGAADALIDVLSHYRRVSELQRAGALRNGDARLGVIQLTEDDLASLAAFLGSLTEDYQ
ncbi:MAG TPA: hypothetical protein VK454_08495 [Myxococcaceae bacterium]|nr:hypothetical protein [Myxococcaceae bacterium]